MQRRVTYEVTSSEKPVREKPWWQLCKLDEFKARIREMKVSTQTVLYHDIKAAMSATQKVIESVEASTDHRARARYALNSMAEKKHLLSAIFHARDLTHQDINKRNKPKKEEREQRREDLVAKARVALAAGNIEEAVTCILNILERPRQNA